MESHQIVTNGVVRTFIGKRWSTPKGLEFRAYRIHGDITDTEQLAEAAQELSLVTECPLIKLVL